MPLPPLYGHEGLRDRLEGAIASGRFPQSLLFTGPSGVGKQRLGLWVAQALLCGAGAKTPCNACEHCRRVGDLAHPDLHWFVPLEPPKRALDEEKKVEWAEGALGEVLAGRRQSPLYGRPAGMASHSLASVRLLLKRLNMKPALARVKVFVVGDAERLIVQEASQEAANALLKAVEEPPADTFIILTASDPDALLPTIRSRVATVRVARVPDTVVAAFLEREMKPPLSAAEIGRRVAQAEGSIGRAAAADIEAGAGGGSGGGAGTLAARAIEAIGQGPVARYELALGQMPWSARGEFTALLDGMLIELRRRALARPSRGAVRSIELVLEKRAQAQGNVNPQLLLARLLDELAMVA